MAIIGPTVTTRNVRGTTVRLVGSEPQTVSSGVAVDIDGVVTLIASALADYQRRLGVAPAKTLTLREAYPKDPVENPGTSIHQVFYRLRRRPRCPANSKYLQRAARRYEPSGSVRRARRPGSQSRSARDRRM